MRIKLTPRPEKHELIVALQIGAQGRLLVAQVSNLASTRPQALEGSGPQFVRQVEAALQAYVPKPHFVYQVLSILRKANQESA
ncbi:hypothetical protein CEB3_c13870 [Peptococcaceae bacterium CEB3]|nr:hypothetical protein CEB3_c13870 [Peptococcaceae bacterium CEB3]